MQRKVAGLIPERMVSVMQYAFSGACCVQILCKLWQILHDQALKIVADFSLLFEFGNFT